MLKQWPDATITLLVKRNKDESPYVAVTELVDGILCWPVTRAETAVPGNGLIEIRATRGETIAKSVTGFIRVSAALTGNETDPPETAKSWVDQVIEYGNEAVQAAVKAKEEADRLSGINAKAVTLPEGSEATVTVEEGCLVYGIPRGDKGDTGDVGPQGPQGPKGEQGVPGADGKDAVVDATLTQSGQAADAKVTGGTFSQLKDDLDNLSNSPISPDRIQKDNTSTVDITESAVIYSGKTISGTNVNGGKFTIGTRDNNVLHAYFSESVSGSIKYRRSAAIGYHLCITTLDDTNLIFMTSTKLDNIAAGIEKFDWISVSGKFVAGTDTYVTIDIGKAKANLNGGDDIKLYVSSLIADDIRISNIVESKKYEYSDFKWLGKIKSGDIAEEAIGSNHLKKRAVTYEKLSDEVKVKLLPSGGSVVMPNTLVIPTGKTVDVHFENIFKGVNPEKMNNCGMSRGIYMDGFKRYSFDSTSPDFSATIFCALASEEGKSISKNISVKMSKTQLQTVKRGLFIGDSITAQGSYIGRLKEILPNIELLGTLNTAGNDKQYSDYPCEGRGGWAAYNYCNDISFNGYENPFYNNGFDFSHYMQNNGYTGVDFVFINLGTNDPIRGDKTMEQIIACYNLMINSIKAYDPNIKIMIWLPPARAIAFNANHFAISEALKVNEALIAEFDDRQSENIILIPVNCCIDPLRDYKFTETKVSQYNEEMVRTVSDAIHPALSGHMKIADLIFGYVNYYSN